MSRQVYDHGLVVERSEPDAFWKECWQPVRFGSLPAFHEVVWAYVPELRGEDGRYGAVVLAMRSYWCTWKTIAGEEILPVFWAVLDKPRMPLSPEPSAHCARVIAEKVCNRIATGSESETQP